MANALSVRWDVSLQEAQALQQALRERIVTEDDFQAPPRLVGGIDVGIEGDSAVAAIAVLTFPDLAPHAQSRARVRLSFPYIPGLLAFREGPAIEAAWAQLPEESRPELLMFDGQGIAHPRGIGIASQMGLILDRPSIGVAKSILVGRHEPVPDTVGAWQPLTYRRQVVGAAVRLRAGVKPVFVSPGHRISLPTAIDYVVACARGFKLPEPTRWAHKVAAGQPLPGF